MTRVVQAKHENEIRGVHVLLAFVAFFGVIIAVNLTMAFIASNTWTGLVVKNTYVASQEYNTWLSEAKKQAALGWKPRLSYKNHTLIFSLKDKDGRPVFLQNVQIKVGRPAFEQRDRVIPASSLKNGIYSAETILEEGPWDLVVTGQSSLGNYRIEKRLHISTTDNANQPRTL